MGVRFQGLLHVFSGGRRHSTPGRSPTLPLPPPIPASGNEAPHGWVSGGCEHGDLPRNRSGIAGTMAAALSVGPSTPAAAKGARLAMRVVVYDYAQVRPDLLAQAKMVVSSIFGAIDVDAVWMEVAEFTREMPSENAARRAFVDSVVQVNVISPDMHKMLGRKSSVLGGAGSRTQSRVGRVLAESNSREAGEGRRQRRPRLGDRARDWTRAHAARRTCRYRSHAARCRPESDCAESSVLSFRRGDAHSRNAGGRRFCISRTRWCGGSADSAVAVPADRQADPSRGR